jgi:hypothetical protein
MSESERNIWSGVIQDQVEKSKEFYDRTRSPCLEGLLARVGSRYFHRLTRRADETLRDHWIEEPPSCRFSCY